MTRDNRGRLDHGAEWFLSPAADQAIDAALSADGRRSWDPRRDSPSLATLQGKAKNYGGHYVRSRARLLRAAGVRVRAHYGRTTGALAWIVVLPGEPLSAAVCADRVRRLLLVRREKVRRED